MRVMEVIVFIEQMDTMEAIESIVSVRDFYDRLLFMGLDYYFVGLIKKVLNRLWINILDL